MAKRIENITPKVNLLTFLELSEPYIDPKTKSKARMVLCRCDCGTVKPVRLSLYMRGVIKSCGCIQKNFASNLNKTKVIPPTMNDLTFIEEGEPYIDPKSGDKKRTILCRCKCGNETVVRLTMYINGRTKSCGCKNYDSGKNTTHGDSKKDSKHHYLFYTFYSMKDRCYRKNNSHYKYYGARGITIYSEWVNNYQAFKDWILENLGERPEGYSIDRIDPDGNYEPGNIRWADNSTQAQNQRRHKKKA